MDIVIILGIIVASLMIIVGAGMIIYLRRRKRENKPDERVKDESWKQRFEHWLIFNLQITSKSNVQLIIDHVERYIRPASQPSSALVENEINDADEKEVMMQAFDKVRQLFESRSWIMEGRGSYRYDDDRYKEEVRYLFDEFDQLQKDTWKNIKSKSFEYRNKIIADYKASPLSAGEQNEGYDLEKLYEWLMDENRKQAQTYFTASMARNIAKEIEYRLSQSKPSEHIG